MKVLFYILVLLSSSHAFSQMDSNICKEEIFISPEISPEPIGGVIKLRKYMSKYVENECLKRNCIFNGNRTVFVLFTVGIDGKLKEFKIRKGINKGCDKVAIDAIKSYGKWVPGKMKDEIVEREMAVPIRFYKK